MKPEGDGRYLELEVEIVETGNVGGRQAVKIEETPFYPDGKGGQLGDRGTIGGAEVLQVLEREDGIWHLVDGPLDVGRTVARIDLERRREIAEQHTAQHILSAALLETSGIETVGFHMGEIYSTIDLDVPILTEDALRASLELANEIVRSCIPVEIVEVDLEDVKHYKLRKPLSAKVLESGEFVRLVKIGDFDVSACGGFHVENTGMVGMIGIVKTEKVKKVLTRVYFVAGRRLERYLHEVNTVLSRLTSTLTCSVDELVDRTENLLNEMKEAKNLNKRLGEKLAKEIASKDNFERLNGVRLVLWEGEQEVATFLPKYLKDYFLVAKTGDTFTLASDTLDCSAVVASLRGMDALKGGGAGKRRGQVVSSLSLEAFGELVRRVMSGEHADPSPQR